MLNTFEQSKNFFETRSLLTFGGVREEAGIEEVGVIIDIPFFASVVCRDSL